MTMNFAPLIQMVNPTPNLILWRFQVDSNVSKLMCFSKLCFQVKYKILSHEKGLGSMDEPCSKLEDVIRSKIHSVERLPRKLGYKTYRK